MLVLVSADNDCFEVGSAVIGQSELLQSTKEMDDEGDAEVFVPFASDVLARVLSFLERAARHTMTLPPKPLRGPIERFLPRWVSEFLRVNEDRLVDLFSAADYLMANELCELILAKFASILNEMTPSQVRETFGYRDDLHPDQLVEVGRTARWT